MTQLLVSVRSAEEATTAVDGGAHIIDVKEPSRGSLGRADGQTWRDVVDAVAGRCPVSVACGELSERTHPSMISANETAARDTVLNQVDFAKIGMARCALTTDWGVRWLAWRDHLPPNTVAVLVAYVDHIEAESPPLEEFVRFAVRHRVAGLLLDTFRKSHRGLLDFVSTNEITRTRDALRKTNTWLALAGSLDSFSLARVLQLSPQIVAVRGAACADGREGTIERDRVTQLAQILHCHVEKSRILVAAARGRKMLDN